VATLSRESLNLVTAPSNLYTFFLHFSEMNNVALLSAFPNIQKFFFMALQLCLFFLSERFPRFRELYKSCHQIW
jgi:hypothetical protein